MNEWMNHWLIDWLDVENSLLPTLKNDDDKK